MDFRQAEIGDVLRLLARQYGLNIIVAEGVKGPISVRFSNVTMEDALDAIITVNGYAYTRRGHVMRVITPEAAAREVEREIPTTRVFPLRYANAQRLVTPLEAVISKGGSIRADDRSNRLIITDVPSSLDAIVEVIQSLDTPTPQVLIETKVIESALNDEERMGINWNLLASLQGSAQPTTFPIPQRTATGPILNQFRPVGQTSSESTTTTTATGATATASSTAFPSGTEGFPTFPFVAPGLFTFGTLSFNQTKIILQMLESRAHTRALAAPSITTLDNQEAQIVIGSNVPVPTFTQNKNTGEFEITGYTDRKTGVVLRVTPHVTMDQRILLDIHPQVSNIERFIGDPRAQVPVTSTREADTRVSLKTGETVVIGGLLDERDRVNKHYLPVLGKIPFVGRLFRFDEVTKGRTDLMIFITAYVLTDEQQTAKTLEAVVKTGRPELFAKPQAPAQAPAPSFKMQFKQSKTGARLPMERSEGGQAPQRSITAEKTDGS